MKYCPQDFPTENLYKKNTISKDIIWLTMTSAVVHEILVFMNNMFF